MHLIVMMVKCSQRRGCLAEFYLAALSDDHMSSLRLCCASTCVSVAAARVIYFMGWKEETK